jgi:hypothetical protein
MDEFFKAHWHQIWGTAVACFGVYFAYRRDIPVSFNNGRVLFHVKGKKAILLGLVISLLGIVVALNIPKFFKIDRCLDNGGRFDYEKSQCIYGVSMQPLNMAMNPDGYAAYYLKRYTY